MLFFIGKYTWKNLNVFYLLVISYSVRDQLVWKLNKGEKKNRE